jgi:O-antigen/teichoic acid export membrane protein
MIKKLLPKSEFAKNVFTLSFGSFISQVINFALTAYLARIYLPEDFGAVTVFTSIVSFVLVISCGKFDVAMVAAKNEDDATRLFSLSHVILIMVSLIMLFFIFIISVFHFSFYTQNKFHEWLWYAPLSVFLITGGHVLWMWNARAKRFKNISFIRILEVITLGIIAIILKNNGANGLFFATLAGQLVLFVILGVGLLQKHGIRQFVFPKKELKKIFVKYSNFPKINILQGYVDIFQVSIVVLVISFGHFASNVTGLYGLCMRVLQAPMWLIVKPIGVVFFTEVAARHRINENLYPLVKKTIYKTSLVALPIPLILLFFGPSLFAFLFGSNWYEAGVYAQIFSLWIFFDLVKTPVAQVASVLGKQHQLLVVSLIGNVLLLICIVIGIYFSLDVKYIFVLISIAQSLIALLVIILCLRMTKSMQKTIVL